MKMEFVTNGNSGLVNTVASYEGIEGKIVITEEEERDIIGYINLMSKISNPRTTKDIPRIVKYVLDKRRKKLFNDGSNLPSSSWVQSFLKRHPNLQKKIPYDRPPKATTNMDTVKRFYSKLTIFLMEEHGLNSKNFLRRCNSHRIFTCDEAIFHLNINEYSKKQGGNLKKFSKLDAEGKSTRTALICMSASGNVLQPLIVNSGLTPTQYNSDTGGKFWVSSSDKGFMTAKVFYYWLVDCFEPYLTQTHIERPVILFIDGHFCHLNIPALLFTKQKKIIVYCLSIDASHLVQPVDATCFKPIEENYKKILKDHANMAGIVSPKTFPDLLLQTMTKSRLQSKAVIGFEDTGIVPFNSDSIEKSKLTSSNNCLPEVHVPEMSLCEDKEKTIPSYEDSIVVIRAELNALQDFLLRIETILPRPYVAHFEEKHEAGEDVLDHSFFIWRDLKEKIRDIQTWLLQAQEENPHLFHSGDPSIHLISQENQSSSLVQIDFPHQNPMINFVGGSDPRNPMVGFHETSSSLQNVIETFPENSLENFQETVTHQQGSMEGFSESSTPANPIVTFTESAQHHIECFTENSTNQSSLENFSSSYQSATEDAYTDNNLSQNSEESTDISPPGKRSSARSSPIKGKFTVGSLYRNPVVALVRTPMENGKISSPESSKTKKSPGRPPKIAEEKMKKKLASPQVKRKAITESPKTPKKIKQQTKKEEKKKKTVDNDKTPVKKSFDGRCIVCKKKDGSNKVWIGCDCGNWCHKACVKISDKLSNIQIKKLDFKCAFCKRKKKNQ